MTCIEFPDDLVWFSPDIDTVMRTSEAMLNHMLCVSNIVLGRQKVFVCDAVVGCLVIFSQMMMCHI